MKLVTAADVWYTQQQKTLDEIAEKLGVVAYRPSYHGAERDKNTVLFYLKEDEEHNREVDRQPVRYSRSEPMILHPVTPTALHPHPMHIVSA